MTRILSVSYDSALLSSRQLLLESVGCEVFSAHNLDEAMRICCGPVKFQLLIVGHSIPLADKNAIIAAFRARCSGPVIALKRFGEEFASPADFFIEPDPGQLLNLISRLLNERAASA
jgi:DNA-binding response OmpR family regulator